MSSFQLLNYDPVSQYPMGEGIYLGLPDETYFAHHAVSNSQLKVFSTKSPAHLKYGERNETRAQSFGKLMHCGILEPEDFEKRFMASDATRVGTKEWDADVARAAGRQVVKRPEFEEALRLRDTVLGRPGVLRDLVLHPGCTKEFAFFWRDPLTGVECRGKADGALLEHGIGFDLKSCEDAGEKFMSSVREYRYHWQNAFYCDGLAALDAPLEEFLFIAIEKTYPYQYQAWDLPRWLIAKARERYQDTLIEYAKCLHNDVWPGYRQNIQTLPYPERWAQYE
jgi:exodeoxyribonuclease VIII